MLRSGARIIGPRPILLVDLWAFVVPRSPQKPLPFLRQPQP